MKNKKIFGSIGSLLLAVGGFVLASCGGGSNPTTTTPKNLEIMILSVPKTIIEPILWKSRAFTRLKISSSKSFDIFAVLSLNINEYFLLAYIEIEIFSKKWIIILTIKYK